MNARETLSASVCHGTVIVLLLIGAIINLTVKSICYESLSFFGIDIAINKNTHNAAHQTHTLLITQRPQSVRAVLVQEHSQLVPPRPKVSHSGVTPEPVLPVRVRECSVRESVCVHRV